MTTPTPGRKAASERKLTATERRELAAWLRATKDTANRWADRIDPRRTQQAGGLQQRLDEIASIANMAVGWVEEEASDG